ncbi:MAG: ribose 5-phosphate isomerase B [Chloroflexi bacterium]|nr:ribose 5-phosphate isomerase B [Chloroflexota bacterium]MBP8056518.1 ribose 5-phosphate isomerase B [Chloroflexota bacterium]
MSQSPADVAALVREVVSRTLGQNLPAAATRPIVDADLVQTWPAGSEQVIAPGTLITPLARQVALERRIHLREGQEPVAAANPILKLVALAADHGGYALKEQLKVFIQKEGYTVLDCGTHNTDAVDYPDLAYAAAQHVSNGKAWRAIIIDGAGIGSCMVANKVPGVRAAMCYDQATASNSREHNNANILTLGAGLIGPNLAQQIVKTFLTTEFAGGRHTRRVDKIDAIARRFQK